MTLKTHVYTPPHAPTHTVIWLHGLGADGYDFSDMPARLQLPDHLQVKFIFPHAPVRPVTLNANLPMRAWFDVFDLGETGKIDAAGIAETDQLLRALIQQEQDQGICLSRIMLAGFSQGGVMALYTGLTIAEKLAGLIGLSTFLPAPLLTSPQQPTTTPIFMAHGSQDDIVSPHLFKHACNHLKAHGYHHVTQHSYPMAHGMCDSEINHLRAFLKTHLTTNSKA